MLDAGIFRLGQMVIHLTVSVAKEDEPCYASRAATISQKLLRAPVIYHGAHAGESD